MREFSADDVRALIVSRLHASILEAGFDPAMLADDFDVLTSGVIDSIGLVELLAAVEQEIGFSLDLTNLDPENLTVLGPLCRYIEQQCFQFIEEKLFSARLGNQALMK
jgi:acyl carrier protein